MKKWFLIIWAISCLPFFNMQADSGERQFVHWAPTPPMGWNSWDCYGPTVVEDEVKANADYMAKYLKPCEIIDSSTRERFLDNEYLISELFTSEGKNRVVQEEPVLPIDAERQPSEHSVTFRMEHIHIEYGKRTILKDLDWEVKNGEKWSLSGPNGSGKSTLLSLIYADNPQAYANTLYLFDRKRGTGESIWEIKKRIGYVSPEMHLYYMENVPAVDIVGSGFFDSIGLYRICSAQQLFVAKEWMHE